MKRCPFCGQDNLVIEMKSSAWNANHKEAHIVCNECAASAPLDVWQGRFKHRQEKIANNVIRLIQR